MNPFQSSRPAALHLPPVATADPRRGGWLRAFVLAAASTALPALAAPPAGDMPACGLGDLTGVTVTSCTGFFQGNLLQGNTGDGVSGAIAAQLSAIGMVNPSGASYLEKIGSNGGAFSIDFSTPLAGDTVIGLHLGGGSNRFSSNLAGGATAFYRFDAGSSSDLLNLVSTMSASSGVALFQTAAFTPPYNPALPAVPEPQTPALLLAGLAAVGFAVRRRVAQDAARGAFDRR